MHSPKGKTFSDNFQRILAEHEPPWNGAHVVVALETHGCQVTFRTVDNWLKGRTQPTVGDASALAEALGCSVDDFFEEPEEAEV